MNTDTIIKHLVSLIKNYYPENDSNLSLETKKLLIERYEKNIDATEVTTEILEMWIDDDFHDYDSRNFNNLAFDIQCLLQVNGFRSAGY